MNIDSNNTPKVSVIVPVLNTEHYLKECLDSILAQTLIDIEIICGDGGSTDGSLKILQHYAEKDSRITVVSKTNSGYGQSLNECIRMAKGEYIGIVESDDVIRPEMFERLYQVAREKNLDWVKGDIYLYYTSNDGKPILKYEKIIKGNFYNKVLNPQKDLESYRCQLRTWSGIYCRKFLEEHYIMHNETPGASYQDVGFYLKTLYYAKRVAFIHHALYMWRQDNEASSIHIDSLQLIERSYREWMLNLEYLNAHPELGKQAIYGYRYIQFLAYMWMIEKCEGAVRKHLQIEVWKQLEKVDRENEYNRAYFTFGEWRKLRLFLRTGNTASLSKWIKKGCKSLLNTCGMKYII